MRRVHVMVEGQTDFPDAEQCTGDALYPRVTCLEQAFWTDIGCGNFVPYLSVHEFESLLFSDPPQFGNWFDEPARLAQFSAAVSAYPNPEYINDQPTTAPSKRIEAAFGYCGYQNRCMDP